MGQAISLAQMVENFGGDRELVAQVANIFLDDYRGQLSALGDAAQAGDLDRAQAAAHGLKGAMGNFGATDAVRTARELELACKAGNAADLAALAATLAERVEVAATALRAQLPDL